MARWNGTTKQRGYHSRHQAERRRRLARWTPGDLCAHCGQPLLYRWRIGRDGKRITALDLPHTADRTGYLPGLAHAYCNRSEGATRGNQQRRTGWAAASRTW